MIKSAVIKLQTGKGREREEGCRALVSEPGEGGSPVKAGVRAVLEPGAESRGTGNYAFLPGARR
jgi:hypothetical protein